MDSIFSILQQKYLKSIQKLIAIYDAYKKYIARYIIDK